MKRIPGILVISIILSVAGQQAGAQNFKFGYINRDVLFKSIPEYDSATVKVEKLRSQLVLQLESMQADLSRKNADLSDPTKTSSDVVRKTREQEVKDLNTRIQIFQVQATQQINNKNSELIQPIINKAEKAIQDVSKEQGFTFVFDSGVLYYFDEKKSTNLVPLVLAKLGINKAK
jgi:outer membrane protein